MFRRKMKAFPKVMKQTHNTITAEFNSLACYDTTLKSLSTEIFFFWTAILSQLKCSSELFLLAWKNSHFEKKEDFINFNI